MLFTSNNSFFGCLIIQLPLLSHRVNVAMFHLQNVQLFGKPMRLSSSKFSYVEIKGNNVSAFEMVLCTYVVHFVLNVRVSVHLVCPYRLLAFVILSNNYISQIEHFNPKVFISIITYCSAKTRLCTHVCVYLYSHTVTGLLYHCI